MAKRKRRANREGSVYYNRKLKRWVAAITVRPGRRVVRYARTQREARDALASMTADKHGRRLVEPSQVSVGQLCTTWLENHQVADTTKVSYEGVIRIYVKPCIGRIRVTSLEPEHVIRMLAEMSEAGLSGSTRKHVWCCLKMALAQAVRQGMLYKNPCEVVEIPRVEPSEMSVWTIDEIKRFLSESESERLHALYVIALTTALRQSELFGLQWPDVDFKQPALSVKRAAVQLNGRMVIKEPKTKKSRRSVALTDFGVAALREHRKRMMKEGLSGFEWVFCNTRGGLLQRGNLHRHSFKPLLKRAGVKRIRFHDLRHSVATVLLYLNTNPKIIQEILGHSSISVTMDIYGHSLPGMHEEAIGKLGNLLSNRA